ncbi:MAG: hypothetical protein M3480_04080 [Verrucomicrobiota bacterium]|nr:hypothetical protein [Chthoniobacterales bacterium]MDQ3414141.1 hypothetical protein [Verrucomicrobiota bacterium]
MTDPNNDKEIDWSLCTWKGSRRRQHQDFHALPFSRKLEIIEEMNVFVASRQITVSAVTPAVVQEQPHIDPYTGEHIAPVSRARRADDVAAGEAIPTQWREEFEAAARRPLALRMRYAFIHTYKPVLDDAPYRSWDTTAEYRRWCEENLPDWLGYGRV